jgi:hypothetical protein
MKNKKLIYILLPLVIIVWALVIYRIFFVGQTIPENITTTAKPLIKDSNKEERNTYKLIANYRDPFLGGIKQLIIETEDKETENNIENSNLRRRRTNLSRVRWPEISYGGFIEGDRDRKTTILLKISNRDYLVHEGDTIDQIFIKAFYTDSLIVIYNEEEKTLLK